MSEPSLADHLQSFIFGGLSVALGHTVLAPITRVKLVLQLQGGLKEKTPFPRYKGILRTFFTLIQEQGIKSLWRGNLAHILIFFPAHLADICLFYSLQYSENRGMTYSAANILVPLVVSNPFQIVWTKLATDVSPVRKESSVAQILNSCYTTKSLFRGMGTMLIGRFVYKAFFLLVHFRLYEQLNSPDVSLVNKFLLAQSVTMTAGLIAYPFETVARRLMMQAGTEVRQKGFEIVKEIFKNEGGVLGFYRGWLCTILSAVVNASMLSAYDMLGVGYNKL